MVPCISMYMPDIKTKSAEEEIVVIGVFSFSLEIGYCVVDFMGRNFSCENWNRFVQRRTITEVEVVFLSRVSYVQPMLETRVKSNQL